MRDKLLGEESDDIDIVISMSGIDFSNFVYSYCRKNKINIKDHMKLV